MRLYFWMKFEILNDMHACKQIKNSSARSKRIPTSDFIQIAHFFIIYYTNEYFWTNYINWIMWMHIIHNHIAVRNTVIVLPLFQLSNSLLRLEIRKNWTYRIRCSKTCIIQLTSIFNVFIFFLSFSTIINLTHF